MSKQVLATKQRREQILDAAVHAFAASSFNGASMREISVLVGMSHTGVLHHFPDKAALLAAVLARRVERANRTIGMETGGGLSFMRNLINITASDVADRSELAMYCIITAEAVSPTHPAHGYFAKRYRHVRRSVRSALEDLERNNDYGAKDLPIEIAATQIAGLRNGLNQQWLLAPEEVDLVKVVRTQLQFYIKTAL